MRAVEFQTTIKDGTIVVPAEFRDDLEDRVRVILLSEDRTPGGATLIDRLLSQPLHVAGFVPLSRDEMHAR